MTTQLERGAFRCAWEPSALGIRVQVALGDVPLAQAVLPGVTSERAAGVVDSYLTTLIKAVQAECTKALTAKSPAPLPRLDQSPANSPETSTPVTPPAPPNLGAPSRHPFTESPGAHSTLLRFGNAGLNWPVDKWRDILVEVGCYLAENHTAKFLQALTDPAFQGRKRRSLAMTGDGMRLPWNIALNGDTVGYVETAFGSADILTLARKMLTYCGANPSAFWYELRSDLPAVA